MQDSFGKEGGVGDWAVFGYSGPASIVTVGKILKIKTNVYGQEYLTVLKTDGTVTNVRHIGIIFDSLPEHIKESAINTEINYARK